MRILNLLVAAALILPQATSAQAQGGRTYWRVPSAIGGAMFGAAAGWSIDVARWSGDNCSLCGPSLTMTPIGIGVGAGLGFLGGLSADETLRRGDTLSGARRRWLRTATFLTPPAIGSALAFLVINPVEECVPNQQGGCTEEAKVADDGTVAFLGIGGGILAGWILQDKTKGALRPRVTASTGSLGMSFTYSF